jgi:hypothetical protein
MNLPKRRKTFSFSVPFSQVKNDDENSLQKEGQKKRFLIDDRPT